MTLAGYNLQDNVYIYSNNKCMCVFLISPVPIAEPLTSELIDIPVFYNLAPRPIKYRVSVPIPSHIAQPYYQYLKQLSTFIFKDSLMNLSEIKSFCNVIHYTTSGPSAFILWPESC